MIDREEGTPGLSMDLGHSSPWGLTDGGWKVSRPVRINGQVALGSAATMSWGSVGDGGAVLTRLIPITTIKPGDVPPSLV